MDAFVPTGGAGSTAKVQEKVGSAPNTAGSVSATFDATPTNGNTLIAFMSKRSVGSSGDIATPAGWTRHPGEIHGDNFDGGRSVLFYKVAGVAESATVTISATDVKWLYIAEWAGLVGVIGGSGTGYSAVVQQNTGTTLATGSIMPPADPMVLFAGFNQSARNPDIALQSPWAEDFDVDVDPSGPSVVFGHRIVAIASGSYTAQAISSQPWTYGALLAAFEAGSGGITWIAAPDTVDDDEGSSIDVDGVAIGAASDAFWRGDLGGEFAIGRMTAVLGMETAGNVTILVQGGDAADWSDVATVVALSYDATGSLTADDIDIAWDAAEHRYWRLVLDSGAQDVRVFEVAFLTADVFEEPEPAKAILEIYVHDEDASRWGEATWATGPATGTEGIWSGAGWQDVTPQGVNAHIIWGSRRPGRGILAGQDPASWNVETYDPDRILDPGNFDSPYYPQLVAGIPIRISHEGLVIRTGIIEELSYKHKPPDYRGQILATDTIALLHKAAVPADSILADTLHARIIDAIEAAGIGVGGIPLPPPDYGGPTLADWVEGAATDEPTPVWEIARKAVEEIHWVAFVNHDASLGLRSWGAPLNRGREISAPNLEDLRSVVNEDGVYSVARVQVADPDLDPIEREASPLPRYGRRVIERREPTIDPEGWAAAVLAERSWPGVQYVPGAIHCFTAADVNYFGSLQIMEYVTITVPGAVSVQGRILGGELWAEHRKGSERGATWIFLFQVATDGATAIGLTTLVADGTGDLLLDDMTETDFLEAD